MKIEGGSSANLFQGHLRMAELVVACIQHRAGSNSEKGRAELHNFYL